MALLNGCRGSSELLRHLFLTACLCIQIGSGYTLTLIDVGVDPFRPCGPCHVVSLLPLTLSLFPKLQCKYGVREKFTLSFISYVLDAWRGEDVMLNRSIASSVNGKNSGLAFYLIAGDH